MRILIIILAAAVISAALAQDDDCRFAPKYSQSDLINKESVREDFLEKVVRAEAKFAKDIGYNNRTGLTYDGQQLDVKTGLPYKGPHLFTASSKESIHVGILALALTNNKYANAMYTKDEAMEVINKKIDSYEEFAKNYPGYGGFLPWIQINDKNVTPTWDWTEGVPSLDNGQLFWAAYGLVSVLEDWYPNETELIARWTNFYQSMANNSITIFYQGEGKIRTVTKIKDIQLSVKDNTYTNKLDNCDVDFNVVCWLDDPYEGELFAWMMYFFAPWDAPEEREKMWTVKRAKLQAANYWVPELNTNITVQKGWWFSAHEQWKYLFLPYSYEKLNHQIFLNAEKVRTWDARINKRPGMFASVNGNITQNEQDGGYFSACGVQEVAYQNVTNNYLITPYSTMGLFLANKTVATSWYHNMISGPGGQNKWGSTEGSSIYGDSVAPMTTWDAKMTTVLSIMGGLADYNAKKLSWDKKLNLFLTVVKREWGAVFTDVQGIDAPLAFPNVTIPNNNGREDFVTCRVNDFGENFAWGVATAAYQIEGATEIDGRGRSIWDDFSDIPGRIHNGDTGKIADDFYHKYKDDIQMMKNLGIKHFRMSISWSRILPNGTSNQSNPLGIQFYNDVFDTLLTNGIEPWVTLYHWDLPSAYFNKTSTGGWLSRDIIDKFDDYADFCFKTFGSKVKKWITFNEPQSFSWLGYGLGIHAPGRCSSYMSDKCATDGGGGDTTTEPYIVSHYTILAHAKAVQTYRTKYQKDQGGEIGMDIAAFGYEPWDPENQNDIEAVDTKIVFEYAFYGDPQVFGDYPDKMKNLITNNRLPTFTDEEKLLVKGSYDFLGFNHYASKFAKYTGTEGKDFANDARCDMSDTNKNGTLIGPYADSTWLTIYPPGFRKVLKWLDARYNHPKIYVFENGVSVPGETAKNISEALHDDLRIQYYSDYLQNMQLAITEDGVDVQGYFGWSLMDNFEWTDGYKVRFGMVYIDYNNNQTRYIKDSANWYSNWIKNHTLSASTSDQPSIIEKFEVVI